MPSARALAKLVDDLHRLDVHPVLTLMGDNRPPAQCLASLLHLDQFDAELLPLDQIAAIQ